jgi:hypothetical protein
MDISLLLDDIIDYELLPLIDVKVLNYLKCTNSEWKKRIEEHIEKSAPKFTFIAKFGSLANRDGQFNCPCFVIADKQGNIYVSDYFNHIIQMFDSDGQ